MSTEIERKFIVEAMPAGGLGPGVSIRQGYVAEEGDAEVRVRITDVGATLTVKAGRGRSRAEVEVAISDDDAEQLWGHTEGRRVEKTRHLVEVHGATAEVDVYA